MKGEDSSRSRALELIAGARPNFMKLAPVVRALRRRGDIPFRIVHTGQHYDPGMNDVFFEELGIPVPETHLEVGSGPQGAQTARILERYESHLQQGAPSAAVVFGDVNSTVACALAAAKMRVPVVHVEAGLRSFDRTMPEEINRVVTDALADLLLVSENSGVGNLRREGVPPDKIHFVGNVMIDTLLFERPRAHSLEVLARLGLERGEYGLVTIHRPSNVDDPSILERLLRLFADLAHSCPLIFPVHPRTRASAIAHGLGGLLPEDGMFRCLPPLSYRENLALMEGARLVFTDSGGMQEETSVLGVPCLTLRENTERPVTVEKGTSRLVGNGSASIEAAFREVLAGNWPKGSSIPLWDGEAAGRIVEILAGWLRP